MPYELIRTPGHVIPTLDSWWLDKRAKLICIEVVNRRNKLQDLEAYIIVDPNGSLISLTIRSARIVCYTCSSLQLTEVSGNFI